jgi:integrase
MNPMVKKFKGKWQVDCQPGGRDNKRYKRLFDTQNEAKRFEVYLLSEYNQSKEWNGLAKKDNRTLFQLCELWYQLHGRNLKDGVGRLALLQNMCDKLNDPMLDNFSKKQFAKYREKRLKEVSAATVNHDHSYLNAVFEELIRLGEVEYNPIKGIRKLKTDETELYFLTSEQIKRLFVELGNSLNDSLITVVKICLSCGTRWSEAEKLEENQIRNGSIYLGKTKSGKNRVLPISKDLEKEILSKLPFTPCSQAFKAAMKRADIQTPAGQMTHILRHTFASHFMANGGNILVLQNALGHSDLKMTIRYAHFAPDHLQEIKELNPLKSI